MKTIELTRGAVTLVDDDVYEWASKFNWYAVHNGGGVYAVRGIERHKKIRLQRAIMRPGKKQKVDHINGDTLDNRRENLRVATHSQNLMGYRKPKKPASSKFRGVSWHARQKKWIAHFGLNKKLVHLGYFRKEEAAALAYDSAVKSFFGEFAQLNFPAHA